MIFNTWTSSFSKLFQVDFLFVRISKIRQ